MIFSPLNQLSISIEKQGPTQIQKASFPLRYGKYSEIRTPEYEFLFNLNGEIKFIRGLNTNWPHPAEQLKRTDGNDWVYYTVGDKSGEAGIISWLGEYYLPCLPYPSNSIWDVNYFSNPNIMNGLGAWSQLYGDLYMAPKEGLSPKVRDIMNLVLNNNEKVLLERPERLDEIIGGPVSVLPPDTRHVDYEVIPLIIADGCLYHCEFCCVKSPKRFNARTKTDIIDQIQQLKRFYGRNLDNYNGIFLGNHDALQAGTDLISFTASEAHKVFGFGEPGEKIPALFMFGSVDSLLGADLALFDQMNVLPFYTYINVGFESMDAKTLAFIHKPLEVSKVLDAYHKMLEINEAYPNIEITGNFLLGEPLSPEHYQTLAELLENTPPPSHGKGAIYLSPIKDSPKKRELLPQFLEIKKQSRLNIYIYLIQRL